VLIGESLYQYPTLENQTGVGDLFWVELNITATPPVGGTLTSEINITNPDTWVQRPDFTLPTINRFNTPYTFTSPKVVPKLPVALFNYSPTSPLVNQTITFDASASYDPVGTIVAWAWTFGDTGTASGKIVTHNYTSPGTYQVNLTVTDNGGLSNRTTKQITVRAKGAKLIGDINGDGRVDMKDVEIAADAFGSYGPNYLYPGSPASPRWDPRADITGPQYLVPDDKVDLLDVAVIVQNFGHRSS
jgi:PKD repeat protein